MVPLNLVEKDEVFIDHDLLRYFQMNKEINDYFFNFEKNHKASIKRFFDDVDELMAKFLPEDLIRNLKDVLSNMAYVVEGECYKETEIPCLRQLQFIRNQEPK